MAKGLFAPGGTYGGTGKMDSTIDTDKVAGSLTKEDVYNAKSIFEGLKNSEKLPNDQISLLSPEQEKTNRQLQLAAQQGSFGPAADYYRGLLSNENADMQAFQAPEMRRYQEQTIPGLAEQFAGMGAGGLSSSGFRNAGVQASTDLGERLASIRANLRQNAAQGLMNLGSTALNPTRENTYQQPAPSMWGPIMGAAGTAVGAYFGGPGGAAAGYGVGSGVGSSIGNYMNNSSNIYGQSSSIMPG